MLNYFARPSKGCVLLWNCLRMHMEILIIYLDIVMLFCYYYTDVYGVYTCDTARRSCTLDWYSVCAFIWSLLAFITYHPYSVIASVLALTQTIIHVMRQLVYS